jgi:SNF2 family DNA or RNA helicase
MKYKTEPRPYQQHVVTATYQQPYAALFLEQGLGKSKVIIDTAMNLFPKIQGLLVVSKKVVVENWHLQELPTHAENYQSYLYSTSNKNKMYPIQVMTKSKLNVLLINDGCLRTPHGLAYAEAFLARFDTLLVVDESTIIKNPTAAITKKLIKLATQAEYRRILSGEPAPQGPTDLYSQYKFLSPTIIPGTFNAFKYRFCELTPVWVNGRKIDTTTGQFAAGMQPVFEETVAHCTVRIRKADVLPDLPEKQYIPVKYELPPAARQMYDRLADKFFTELVTVQGTAHLTATLAITRATRLHQLVSGEFVADDGVQHSVESGKMEALLELLDDRPKASKTIIWAYYRHSVEEIVQRLAHRYGAASVSYVYGQMLDSMRQAALEHFKGSGRFLVANPSSCAWGLTLTEADVAIYYSNSYNWEHRVQSEDRIHRIGQAAKEVLYYDLVAAGTVEEKILEILHKKADFGKSLLADITGWFGPTARSRQ